MTPKLSTEQRRAIAAQQGGPVFVVDEETHAEYVILSADAFQKLRALLRDETLDLRETYAAQDRVAANDGWDDPAMDDYNDYDAHRSNP